MNEIARPVAGQILPRTRPDRASVVALPGHRAAITGTLAQVGAVLTQLQDRRMLVGASDPIPSGRPGHVIVTARLVPPDIHPRATAAVRRRWTRRRVAVTTGAAVTVAGLLAAAGYTVATWLAAHPIGAVVVVVLLAAGLTTAGRRVCATAVTVIHRH